MSASAIKWTKSDVEALAGNPDYPWKFLPYREVKPTVWYDNHAMGNNMAIIQVSTTFTNVPAGYVPVSPVVVVDGGKSGTPSHALQDTDMIPFIFNDPRFCTVPILTGNTRSSGADGPANAWGCQKAKDPYKGIRMWRMLCDGTDFCSLGDQLTGSNFNPGRMCEGAGKNYYETAASDPPTLFAVHRHLVLWTTAKPYCWFMTGADAELLRAGCFQRLNEYIAMFRVEYMNRDGTNARPVTMRNFLQMSISNDDSAIELADRGKLDKTQISVSASQDNAVDMYRKHFCVANPSTKECSCFREIPDMLKVSQYDIACHDAQCKTYGYKPASLVEGKTCTPLNLQICTQAVNVANNNNSSLVIALKQECGMLNGPTTSSEKNLSGTNPSKGKVGSKLSTSSSSKYIIVVVVILITVIMVITVLV